MTICYNSGGQQFISVYVELSDFNAYGALERLRLSVVTIGGYFEKKKFGCFFNTIATIYYGW